MTTNTAPPNGNTPSQPPHGVNSVLDGNTGVIPSTPVSEQGAPRFMAPPIIAPRVPSISHGNAPIIDDSTIEVASMTPPPVHSASNGRGSGKLTKQYILPDGSVAAGKGLGRGRPGIKRGPKNAQSDHGETTPGPTALTSPQPPPQIATPVNNKRKRTDSDVTNAQAQSTSSAHSRESTPEYNPTSATRSGRQVQKPTPIVTPSPAAASPAKRQSSTTTPILKSHPKIKRKVYRGKEQSALCEHCTRGFGPAGNVIVFCDACNKCWHQKCHSPQIPHEVVADSNAEWFCVTCDKILHGKKSKKVVPPPKPEVPIQPTPPPVQKYGPPLIPAHFLTLEQRKKYLSTLSKERLIDIVLLAGDLAPNMPIFETPLPMPIPLPRFQPQFDSTYVTPITQDNINEVQDEGYDDHFDEHAALYPKPGEGVQLPPDRVDLHMLLEGPESRTFSHWVRGMPMKNIVDTVRLG